MTNEQAINVLVQVAELAQARGILKLNEAPIVFQAVSIFAPNEKKEVVQVPVADPEGKEPIVKSKAIK